MLYLIGLGLNEKGISQEGLEAVKKCKRVYLENYTVDFPYSISVLDEMFKKKIIPANRDFVESLKVIDEAKKMDVALLVYGSPLTATTHITIVQEAKTSRVKCKVIYGASVFDSIAETGLQIYKFGKVTSMPAWKKSYKPTSFMKIVQENKTIKAHSLILVDIGLELEDALVELEESAKEYEIKLDKILICSKLGTGNERIIYDKIENLKETSVKFPYCIIIPGKLHFVEKEFLEEI